MNETEKVIWRHHNNQGRRTRDPARRATVVTYNPGSVSGEYEDSDTMSNIEGPVSNFSRGGYMRSSLPIVRSPPNTYERPMGFVFLIYREETRRAVLPNEITHLDTVRAMFVRAFPQKLNLEILESPRRKIYILETKSSIYYQLEDLRDIRDRAVLKIHECDSFEPQKIKEPAPEIRGKLVQPPAGQRGPGFPGESPATAITDHVRKAQTMPASMAHSYPTYVEMEYERPRSQTPDPARMSRSQGSSSGTYGRVMYQSPERQLSLERPNLRPIPENHQMHNGYIPNNKVSYDDTDGRNQPIYGHLQSSRSQPPPGDPLRRALSPPPTGAISQDYDHFRAPGGPAPGAPPQTYVAHGTRASSVSAPQRATGPGTDPRQAMHNNRHSLAFTPMADKTVSPTKPPVTNGVPRSQSYRVVPDTERSVPLPQRPRSVTPQPVPPDVDSKYDDWFRMDKMEAQIANLAAWVQTAVVSTNSSRASSVRSGASTTPSDIAGSQFGSTPGKVEEEGEFETKGLSDLSTASQTTLTPGIKEGILNIKKQTTELRSDLRNIRRLHQLNKECIQESIQETLQKITKVLSSVPGTENQVLRKQRSETDVHLKSYVSDKAMAFRELSDLEACVEELRFDVLSRHCLVNMADVEGMALLLSQVARCLGELKGLFPSLQEEVKHVLAGEMEVVVKEEKFLKDEPESVEEGLKRCKKLTNTLFTLKRLASVQEHRPHQKTGQTLGGQVPTDSDRKHLLENIVALVPDHNARLQKLEEADASRERKKKIVVKQEALKFGRSLEMATRSLKPASSKEQLEKGPEVTAAQGKDSKPTGSKVKGSPILVHKPTSSTMDATTKSSSLPPSTDKNKGETIRDTDQSEPRPFLTEKSRSLDNQLDARDLMVSDSSVMRKPAVVVSAELPPASKCLPVEGSKTKGDRMAAGKPQSANGKNGSSKRSKSVDSGALEDKDVKRNAEILRIQKNAARANFFSSITTPPTSPEEEKRPVSSPNGAKVMDYTVRISPVKVTVSGETQYTVTPSGSSTQRNAVSSSSGKPTFLPVSSKKEKSGESKSVTPSPTTPSYIITPGGTRVSSIPRISPQKISSGASVQNRDTNEPKTSSSPSSKDSGSSSANGSSSAKSNGKVTEKLDKKVSSDNSADGRQKRPPPPPPPRKSSSRPSSSINPQGQVSPVHSETDPQDSSVVTGHRMGPALNVGTLTSTPKAGITHKPTTKFEKDLAGGKSVSSLGNGDKRRTDTQSAKTDTVETPVTKSEKSPAAALKFDDASDQSEMATRREEREGSSESTTSSSSLDSQQGTIVLRCTSKTNRKPKPPPPARRSSLPLGNNPPVEKTHGSRGKSKVNGRRESEGDVG